MSERRLKALIAVLAALLFVTIVVALLLWERARLPLHHEHHRPLIDRSVQRAAGMWRATPREVERRTFPIAMSLGQRTCVELRGRSDSRPHGRARYLACYEGNAEEPVEEIISTF